MIRSFKVTFAAKYLTGMVTSVPPSSGPLLSAKRNRNETKRNETKQNQSKRNETKRNERFPKRNVMKKKYEKFNMA
jgi:hypothetical protein